MQEQRFLWLLMAIAMGALIIRRTLSSRSISTWHPVSNVYTSLRHVCDGYWRIGCSDQPKDIILKLIGCVMAFYGSILGLSFRSN